MEVTKDNFAEALEILKSRIHSADFIAIDGEFTGLSTLKRSRFSYDTLDEHYMKLVHGSSKFMMIQYGICLFTWSEEESQYEATPFTFYIYPRPYKRNHNDVMFMCQSSSLDFLAGNNFDFNKLFYKGISFMSPWEQKAAEYRLEQEYKNDVAGTSGDEDEKPEDMLQPKDSAVFIPKDQRPFMDGIKDSIAQFLKVPDKTELDLPSCNPFQRKLIYETVEAMYPMGLYLESVVYTEDKSKFIRVHKISSKGVLTKKKMENYQQELNALKEVVGFSKVINLLAEVKKPIIGHNMLLDLFYTVTNFFLEEPPKDLTDFKIVMNSIFPVVIDTKLIATTQPLAGKFSGTSLKRLMESAEDGVIPLPNVVYSDDVKELMTEENQFHQAGYDAYCTGCSFISLSQSLFTGLKIDCKQIDINSDILNPFINRVNIFNLVGIKYVDLSRPDKNPDRKSVFLVTFPKDWKVSHIENLFSGVCPIKHNIVWLNDTSAYVTLQKDYNYDAVMEKLVLNADKNASFTVTPFQKLAPSKSVEADAKPDMKRKRVDELEDGEISNEEEPIPKKDTKKMQKVEARMFEEHNDW